MEVAKALLIVPPERRDRSLLLGFRSVFLSNEFGLLALIVLFSVLFTLVNGNFVSKFNLWSLSRSVAVYAMIGMAMMAVIVTGGLNLAVGAIGVCAAMSFG